MYQLPQNFRAELYKEFDFTREFTDESALLHNWSEGRILCTPLPPFRNGSIELYVNKAMSCTAELIVLVLPCDTSTEWFEKVWSVHPIKTDIRFLRGRMKYEGGKGTGDSRFKHRVQACVVIIRN